MVSYDAQLNWLRLVVQRECSVWIYDDTGDAKVMSLNGERLWIDEGQTFDLLNLVVTCLVQIHMENLLNGMNTVLYHFLHR